MVATSELRYNWRRARKIRRAKKMINKALWRPDRGYGIGKRFGSYEGVSDDVYNKAGEILGSLESAARVLEGRQI